MEPSSKDESVSRQFARFCTMVMKGEAADYHRHMAYIQKHETVLSELSMSEMEQLYTVDEYSLEKQCFQVHGYDVEVRDELLADAIRSLSERKRDVVLLAYFLDLSDSEIARQMNLVRSTVHEHRIRSLEQLRTILEGYKSEKKR